MLCTMPSLSANLFSSPRGENINFIVFHLLCRHLLPSLDLLFPCLIMRLALIFLYLRYYYSALLPFLLFCCFLLASVRVKWRFLLVRWAGLAKTKYLIVFVLKSERACEHGVSFLLPFSRCLWALSCWADGLVDWMRLAAMLLAGDEGADYSTFTLSPD